MLGQVISHRHTPYLVRHQQSRRYESLTGMANLPFLTLLPFTLSRKMFAASRSRYPRLSSSGNQSIPTLSAPVVWCSPVVHDLPSSRGEPVSCIATIKALFVRR